jgi:hypothetical protein
MNISHGSKKPFFAITALLTTAAVLEGGGSISIIGTTGLQAPTGAQGSQGLQRSPGFLNAWSLKGNAGTVDGTNFLGTTDDAPFNIEVNGQRVFRFEPTTHAPNIIGGFSGNFVTSGTSGATIAGGGDPFPGDINQVNSSWGTVGGGFGNTASGIAATVSGGTNNAASGTASAVAGGEFNTASGFESFAAGSNAQADHDNCFVWSDGSGGQLGCAGPNRFVAAASGGVTFFTASDLTTGVSLASGGGSWSSVSDRNLKDHFVPVDGQGILAKLTAIPISTWNYKSQQLSIRHMGPMAQDFYAAFRVGEDDRHITEIDEAGVAFAAIQGLNEKLERSVSVQQTKIASLKEEIEIQRAAFAALAARVSSMERNSASTELARREVPAN